MHATSSGSTSSSADSTLPRFTARRLCACDDALTAADDASVMAIAAPSRHVGYPEVFHVDE